MFFYDIIKLGDNMQFSKHEPVIFLLTGKAGHGKSYSGKVIKEQLSVAVILQTAFYIKYYATKITDWDGTDDTKPRTLLQELGTGLIRQYLNTPDFLVSRLVEDINIMSYYQQYFIVDDIRLASEIDYIKAHFSNVITIKVGRTEHNSHLTEEQQNHITEQGFEYDFDYIIIRDTLTSLKNDIINVVKETLNEEVNK